jgi:hypothetical protein
MKFSFIIVCLVSSTFTISAQALDIQTKVDAAIAEYNNNNIGKSAKLFSEIADYLRAEKAKKLSVFLPAPPEGWVAEESKNLGSSFMGGGSNT